MRYLLFLPLFAHSLLALAQEKHDYIWRFGYRPNEPAFNFGGSELDFNISPPAIRFFKIPFSFTANTAISNGEGQLQFYANGCSIANAQNDTLMGGGYINEGPAAEQYCSFEPQGYPCGNCLMALPDPGDSMRYRLMQISYDIPFYERLLTTQIDMRLDNGLGAVTTKDELVLKDTFADFLTAVRHANGRDWWIPLHKRTSNRIFLYLLDPAGLHGPKIQDIGPIWDYRDWAGQTVFSPDGTKYVRGNHFNGVDLLDFDRCTGLFSNPVHITVLDTVPVCGGLAFSPNSRFLYLSNGYWLHQYDTEAPDIEASRQLIAEYDGFVSPFATRFFHQRLAPDGKIYMTTTNGTNYLHIINNPNQPGTACDFEQHALKLPAYHAFSTPNFPYFRLYDVPGSLCDTLGINAPVSSTSVAEPGVGFRVWPNPASGTVSIDLGGPRHLPERWALYSPLGQVLKTEAWPYGESAVRFSVEGLASGCYYVGLQMTEGGTVMQKLVVFEP